MMNQGGESSTGFESNVAKNYHVADMSQHVSLTAGHYSWSSSVGTGTSTTWNSEVMPNAPTENGTPSSSGYHYHIQGAVSVMGDGQSGANYTSNASTSSSLGAANAAQDYASYAPYPASAQPYMYSNAEYQNYYNYQQPSTGSSSQQVGDCQNSGAPHQSFSSFQHAGSYVAPTSYSSTCYNAGDHQTASGYTNNSYVNQSNYWNGGSSGSYPPHQYQYYTPPVANSTQVTSNVTANSRHYQQFNQWPYYYYSSAPAVSCALGTENMLATSATPARPVQTTSGGCTPPNNQPPPPGTTSWRTESGSSAAPFLQVNHNMETNSLNGSSEVAALASQKQQMDQLPSHYQKPTESSSPLSEKREDHQMAMHSVGPNLEASSTNQVLGNFQSPLQTATVLDTYRVSKMQIPTNPRITSSLAYGMSKVDSSTANAALKPAYISILVQKPCNASHGDADTLMKGTLPASLRTYVERTFARCKDDLQRAANQKLMKEVITRASADGTLFTRNWDIEPLFPLQISTSDEANQNVTSTTLPKFKRSPNRRMKSRWEPIADEKLAEKLASANYNLTKGAEKVVDNKKNGSNDNGWNGIKFVPNQQQTPLSNIAHRPEKKPRFANLMNEMATCDASSDSDKEQGLTKYYASAIALADSPEEKKRREHRVKRFEKPKVNQSEAKLYRPKISGAGNTYIRRETAMLLSKNSEASCSRAVEDIDWNALTVKGTCQEVEKRYLRLTSAPDPATVRPEEILEKALQMVGASQKNYLYKCDQLKSLRQDLTVQRIQNELTVKVYEAHARLALEAGDLPEYNQCQSQLKRLYAEGIQGCYMEFSAYNLLCVILHSSNNRDLLSAMARLSIEAKEDGAVKHALAVRSAVSSGNYIRFFRLYKAAPNLNTCLMDLCVEKMRFNAIKSICKSYRPTLPVSYIAQNLGFSKEERSDGEGKDASGLDECIEWLKAHGAVLTTDSNGEPQLDTKVSTSSLYMPEPEDAVAHGDATLAVDDFLTRAAS